MYACISTHYGDMLTVRAAETLDLCALTETLIMPLSPIASKPQIPQSERLYNNTL